MMPSLQLPKITVSNWITIGSLAIAVICIFVLFHTCNRPPKDNSQITVDSIVKVQKAREDSLQKIIDSTNEAAQIATDNADSFYIESEKQKQRAKIAGINLEGLKKKYELLRAAHDSTALDAADSVIGAAQDQIYKLDSTVKIKDKVIVETKTAYFNLKKQNESLRVSREAFKQDFMNLNTNVVIPLQAQLKNANKQWAANRFWKKTFAGAAAAAIIYGTIQTFKK